MKRRNVLSTLFAAFLVGVTVTFAADVAGTAKATPVEKKLPIKGNAESKVYHKSTCQYYKSKKTTVVFKTEADAKKAGYRACKKCFPKKKEVKPTTTKKVTPVK